MKVYSERKHTHDNPNVTMMEGTPAIQHDIDGVRVVVSHLGLELVQGLEVNLEGKLVNT